MPRPLIVAHFKQRSRRMAASFFAIVSIFTFSDVAAQEAQSTAELSIPQVRIIARQALANGDARLASTFASVLIQNDPSDAEAWLIRGLLARTAGDLDLAYDAASTAYSNAPNDRLAFDAAMLAADLAARQERFTRSQIWLRRADEAAGNAQQRRWLRIRTGPSLAATRCPSSLDSPRGQTTTSTVAQKKLTIPGR